MIDDWRINFFDCIFQYFCLCMEKNCVKLTKYLMKYERIKIAVIRILFKLMKNSVQNAG